MKPISFYQLFQKIVKTILRFPLVFASLIGTFIVIIYLTDHNITPEGNFDVDILEKFLPFLIINFFLMLAVDLYSEKQKINSIYLNVPIVVILWLYFSGPAKSLEDFSSAKIALILLLIFTSIILASSLLFINGRAQNGFWQYNTKLIVRFISIFFVTIVFYLELSLFLQAIILLTNPDLDLYFFDIEDGNFWRIISIVVTIGTLFFLLGIPETSTIAYSEKKLPKIGKS